MVPKVSSACGDLFLWGGMRYGPGFVKWAVLCKGDRLDGSSFKKGCKEDHGMKCYLREVGKMAEEGQ